MTAVLTGRVSVIGSPCWIGSPIIGSVRLPAHPTGLDCQKESRPSSGTAKSPITGSVHLPAGVVCRKLPHSIGVLKTIAGANIPISD
jgi:hypothetical protein